MPLTDVALRNAKPKESPYKLADEKGLYLLVKPEGARYWRLKYRHVGKENGLALGVYPEVSLAEAREARDEARKLLKRGIDPSADRKERRRAAAVAAVSTFEAVAREWIESQAGRWTERHMGKVLLSLEADIFPDLGARPINEITAPVLLSVMRKVEARGALDTASRLLQRTGAVFRYGIVTGRCERNPAADLRGALKVRKRENHASLPAAELPELLRKMESYDGHLQTRLALKLLTLTFVRTGELRAAEWSEFDLDAALWRIPASRMKMKAEHLVPLSRQAIEAVEALRPLTGRGELLFPNQARPEKPMSENTILYALYRMGYHSRATGHGFRSTASTILNEMGFNHDAIERQLAHTERNKVRGAYNKAEHLPERIDMMQTWADYLDSLAGGAKVTPLRRRTA
jgi:integrase